MYLILVILSLFAFQFLVYKRLPLMPAVSLYCHIRFFIMIFLSFIQTFIMFLRNCFIVSVFYLHSLTLTLLLAWCWLWLILLLLLPFWLPLPASSPQHQPHPESHNQEQNAANYCRNKYSQAWVGRCFSWLTLPCFDIAVTICGTGEQKKMLTDLS